MPSMVHRIVCGTALAIPLGALPALAGTNWTGKTVVLKGGKLVHLEITKPDGKTQTQPATRPRCIVGLVTKSPHLTQDRNSLVLRVLRYRKDSSEVDL
jgi:hypothetical protein